MPLPHRSQFPQKFYWWFFQTVPGKEWGCVRELGVRSEDFCFSLHCPMNTHVCIIISDSLSSLQDKPQLQPPQAGCPGN